MPWYYLGEAALVPSPSQGASGTLDEDTGAQCLSTFENLGFGLSMMWFLAGKTDAIELPKHLHWMTTSESHTTCQISSCP